MKLLGQALLLLCVASLGACSRQEPTAPAASSTPAAAAEPAVTPPAVDNAPVQLAPELLARLERPHSPVLGAAKGRVTVVEVLDPACEACRAFAPVVEQLLFLYPEDVRVVVRYADFHPPSEEVIRLLDASRQQGKFHKALEVLFERQSEWASHSGFDPARAWQIAGESGVDIAKARKDAYADSVNKLLTLEREDLVALKVERTPTFFVNGKLLVDFGPKQLLALVKEEVGKAAQ
jgi:protein-disulfide isomerase